MLEVNLVKAQLLKVLQNCKKRVKILNGFFWGALSIFEGINMIKNTKTKKMRIIF